jgi:hypothetical protein
MSCSMGVNVARGRMLDRSITTSKKISKLSDRARCIYMMLLPYTDREGRLNAHPTYLKGNVFLKLEYTEQDIKQALSECADVELITIYATDEDDAILEVKNFLEHNTPNLKESNSEYPPSSQGKPSTIYAQSMHVQGKCIDCAEVEVKVEVKVEVEDKVKGEVKNAREEFFEDDPLLDQLLLESTLETPVSDLSASSEKDFPKSKTPVDIQNTHPFVDSKTTIHEIQTMLEQTSGSPIEPSGSKTLESNLSGLKPSEPQTNAAKSPHSNEESFRAAGNLRKVLEAQLSAVFGRNKDKILSEHRRKTLWFADPDKSLQTITQARHIAKDATGNMQTLTVNMLDDACKEFAKDDLVKPSSSFVRQRQQEQYEQDQQESFVDFAAMTEKEFEAHVSKFTPAYQGFARTARERLLRTQDKDRQLEHGAVLKKQELVKQAERLYS